MTGHAANLFIDHRRKVELVAVAAAIVVFLLLGSADNFDDTLSEARRGQSYSTFAGVASSLLGFVLAALAILVALPSTERVEALREHPSWPRVTSSYFRAARALLVSVALCVAGITLDSDKNPWRLYEAATLVVLVLVFVRVLAAVLALDLIVGVARQREPRTPNAIDDPGP